MIGFHIDMNVAQFRADYLEKWLRELARIGYDTILWEVENTIQWDSCPECVAPDAFSKQEFKRILGLSRKLGLEPVPLFQTIGHSEYVLKHERYKDLREDPSRPCGQYCARNKDVVPFLGRWINEYLDLFGKIRFFHLGADEAGMLGRCPKCRAYVEKHSKSELYINHINAVSRIVQKRGVTPAIWADMALTHSQALDKLSRKILLFDWRYDSYRGMNAVTVWGHGRFRKENIPPEHLAKYGKFMFPFSDEPCREPDPHYTADFLAAEGFKVVGGPASSCYGDSVFAPTQWRHLANTFSWARKGLAPHLSGVLVTSWTVRLVPWELQLSAIDAPGFAARHPDKSVEAFQSYFMKKRFGLDDPSFWRATGLLSNITIFMESRTLGFYKGCNPTPEGHIAGVLSDLAKEKTIDAELVKSRKLLNDYREALILLRKFSDSAKKGKGLLRMWDWSARNMINRARAAIILLECKKRGISRIPRNSPMRKVSISVLRELRKLRTESKRIFLTMQKPTRTGQIIAWMYDSIEEALASLTR